MKANKLEDPLVEEVRRRGRAVTARYDNDPSRIMEIMRKHAESN